MTTVTEADVLTVIDERDEWERKATEGMRLQVTRKSDGAAMSRIVRPDGTVRL